MKNRKVSGPGNMSSTKGGNTALSRAEINSRDHVGLTVLHRAASTTSEDATSFALALLEHPAIDLYVQDTENGWTALHRALYFGNITVARAIIEKDNRDPSGQGGSSSQRTANSVIKVKDHEGNSPFDVYNATTARRTLQHGRETTESDGGSQDEAETMESETTPERSSSQPAIEGDEIYAWGSARNYTLGFGDNDDRQYPEKITLKRPDHLLFRFYREYLESIHGTVAAVFMDSSKPIPKLVSDLPTLVSNRPIIIQDVALSKLHSAILTTDPESNLYICGFGPGGRLGTGDEVTKFSYACIEEGSLAGKKVISVALGQNHTLALTLDGEVSSFGTNTYGQLGYSLPRPVVKEEEPFCATPRQIFGPLKRERIVGVSASAIHSVAHTITSLFTWGKNEGQLGLMDSDSRSLEVQTVPRRVAASLFKAPINMVSAINGATIVLLANHTVCVFTNYGYNIVKFPLHEGFTNYHLQSNALTTRYDSVSNRISYITGGGDTIAAISSRGDLFTLNVRKIDTSPSTSTTNPSKIRDSLSQPQRVWSLRKGNWDGVKSASVAENGSVIVCTHAGAVWRRVKRAKSKDAFVGTGYSHKDFKFQRVPGLTKVAAVRSTPFGVYAAIRKDCDVTRTQITVQEQDLWQNIAPLLCIRDVEPSFPAEQEDTETPRFCTPALPKELFEPLKRAVLTSPDLEAEVSRHLLGEGLDSYDFEIGTTTSDVRIPVHSFILARSPILRSLLSQFRRNRTAFIPDLLVIQPSVTKNDSATTTGSLFGNPSTTESTSTEGRPSVIFQSLDFITVINLVVNLYTDTVIDVWHFTRHSPKMAFRYRQVRVELMKTAGNLKMNRLESAVRLMTEPERQMNLDMALAIQDPSFFEGGDAIIELHDSAEVVVHSTLLCQRCPFFEGMFNGRAGGQWLAGRRQDESEAVRIDLKHIDAKTFKLVLRYVYADVGIELFDDVVSTDIDKFSELVMDVMAVSNELMLDRLSQICQEVIGRFGESHYLILPDLQSSCGSQYRKRLTQYAVNTRNVCQLLNAIAPCSVTEFKDAALEYLCLQLESMLENHLLNDLDEDLLLELDEMIRGNQLNCLPFAKSGRAELLLHERHPSLAEDIHEERKRRLRDMAFRANLKDDESRLSSSYRARVGSLDDIMSGSPSQEKARRKSKAARNAPFSPSIRPKDLTVDLMFDMDDDTPLGSASPKSPALKPTMDAPSPIMSASHNVSWDEAEPASLPENEISSLPLRTPGVGPSNAKENANPRTKTWSSPALPSSKLVMREIMAQASSSRTSALSMSLSAQNTKEEAAANKSATPKLSQKERKKQQQQALQQAMSQPKITLDKADGKPASPWQVAARGPKTSLKDVLQEPTTSPQSIPSATLDSPVQKGSLTPRRTASPDTRFSGQRRSASSNSVTKPQPPTSGPLRPATKPQPSKSSPVVPHSKSYTTPVAKAEPSLQLSMADIIGQQRREQEVIKEAVAKRSLQEIQEEQAFQEWWDQESRRAQEAEATRANAPASGSGRGGKSGGGRGKSGGGGRGGRGRGGGDTARGRGRGRGQEKATNNQ
jgi:hypothetical protein